MERDDDSADGIINQCLFNTGSDDESGDEKVLDDTSSCEIKKKLTIQHDDETSQDINHGNVEIRGNVDRTHRQIMHVTVEEHAVSSRKISQQLWPAAEYLATFVLSVASIADVDFIHTNESNKRSIKEMEEQLDLKLGTIASVEAWNALEMTLCIDNKTTLGQGSVDALLIVEIGAGIGLTGLEIATQLPSRVLLTDLEEGLELLNVNCSLNKHLFKLGVDAVMVDKCCWGEQNDVENVILWFEAQKEVIGNKNRPWIILGSDVVYWEELHLPLEQTLFNLLSVSPPGSVAILAGMRRWKRDNTFYQSLGKRTRTKNQQLRCVCIKEDVYRISNERQVMRIYVVECLQR